MKFVDEATIQVGGGRGGDGCLSFRRERNVAKGGPDGGDGGDGGDVWLEAAADLNTLVDFRFQPHYAGADGEPGRGAQRTGARGSDATIAVPVGTTVVDAHTHEVLGDLGAAGQRLLIAKGGRRGLGNEHFKSSTNRAPRRTTAGTGGEVRELALQLRLIADTGLLGMPNAGKSTLLRALSAARPKVADYPFTTLIPQLGVVRASAGRSFGLADVPGLIEGAAAGAGLGVRFLKHLSRTRILLHVVDAAPIDGTQPASAVERVACELERFSPALADRERWLVVNKVDTLAADARADTISALVETLSWAGPVYPVSAVTGEGLGALIEAVMDSLETHRARALTHANEAEAEAVLRSEITADVVRGTLASTNAADDDDDDTDDDVDVSYVR